MAIKIVRNGLAAGDYLALRKAVGFSELSPHMADASLNGSLYVVHIEADGKAAGMARVIGDDAQVFIVQEVIVAPAYQGRGFGRTLAREVIDFIESRSSYAGRVLVGLFCFEGNEGFYEKLGLLKPSDETTAPGTIHFIELPRGARIEAYHEQSRDRQDGVRAILNLLVGIEHTNKKDMENVVSFAKRLSAARS